MIAYFDCFSGISGDMILGTLVDAGVSPGELGKKLSCLKVKGYTLRVKKVRRAGFRATKVDVILRSGVKSRKSAVRKWKDLEKIIKSSKLSDGIKQKGLLIFKRLFEAEARVHGSRYDRVHLHELAAVDCIVDIFGTLIGIDMLGIDTVYSSALNLGGGTIRTGHGLLPVPAPAAIELLKDKPVYASDIPFELTTPTGAVLISSLAEGFGPLPDMHITKTGIGAGNKDFREQPNILRLFIGEGKNRTLNIKRGTQTENEVVVIETNIDDMTPQIYEHVMDKLFKARALDVFLTQVIMKKGRPGIKLSVLCSEDKRERIIDIILLETTSIGLRFYRTERKIIQREIKSKDTKFGRVNLKVLKIGKGRKRVSVEYDDCRKIANKFNIPLLEVMKAIGYSL
jgi:uncharacterized protein (TIGR00299 family) protein